LLTTLRPDDTVVHYVTSAAPPHGMVRGDLGPGRSLDELSLTVRRTSEAPGHDPMRLNRIKTARSVCA